MDRLIEGGKRLAHCKWQYTAAKDTNKWKDIPCSLTAKLKCCYNVHTTQRNLKIQLNPYQNPNDIFSEIGENNPKIHMESQRMPNSKNNLERENNARGFTIIKHLYKATVTKTAWYWYKDKTSRPMGHNRKSRNKPLEHNSQIIFNKGTKRTQCGKNSLFKWCWENWLSPHKEWSWTLSLHNTI